MTTPQTDADAAFKRTKVRERMCEAEIAIGATVLIP